MLPAQVHVALGEPPRCSLGIQILTTGKWTALNMPIADEKYPHLGSIAVYRVALQNNPGVNGMHALVHAALCEPCNPICMEN